VVMLWMCSARKRVGGCEQGGNYDGRFYYCVGAKSVGPANTPTFHADCRTSKAIPNICRYIYIYIYIYNIIYKYVRMYVCMCVYKKK